MTPRRRISPPSSRRWRSRRKAKLPEIIADWLDRLDATGRWALIKLITGGLRIGVSARFAKTAVASLGKLDPDEVEEVWHALVIPYRGLFEWLEGKGPKPEARGRATFRPLMLAQPLDEEELAELEPGRFHRRMEMGRRPGPDRGRGAAGAALFALGRRDDGDLSRGRGSCRQRRHLGRRAAGDARRRGAGFADLQKRLNRKSLGPKLLQDYPSACGSTTYCSRATKICARCPSRNAADAWKPGTPQSRGRDSIYRPWSASRIGRSWPRSARPSPPSASRG